MPAINDLDFGPSNPWKLPRSGIHTAVVEIPGGYALPYGVDSTHPAWRLVFKYQARNAVGGYAALSQNAMEYLGRQLEELSRNYDLQPCYIQLFAGTGLVGGAINQPQDGWYYIASCHVDYTEPWTGVGTVTMDVEFVNPGPPRRIGVYTAGGALSSAYSGTPTNWAGLSGLNTVNYQSTVSRTGGEGAVSLYVSSGLNPAPFGLSATVADWFKGGCRVYDAMAGIGTNAVPAAPTFLNTNWIEVKGADHRFVGDIVVTNGLILLTLATGATPGITAYLWNTALGTAGWQQFATLSYYDNAVNQAVLRQVSLLRVGLEELALSVVAGTSAANMALLNLRLQRGSYATRVDFRPLNQANTSGNELVLTFPATPKIIYNSGTGASVAVVDNALGAQSQATATTDYGYAGIFINSATYPFIAGWLYQNAPANQPLYNANTTVGLGDSSGPAQNATRSYSFFAIPFGSVSGGTTVDKLQAEAESGTLGTGWTSQAGAGGNSNGLEAKCASGTLTGNADTFGTAFVPPPQVYDVWFRVKVTNAAGAASEMKLGLYNSTDSVFVSSTTYKANQVTTGYLWYKVAAAVTPTATKNMRFRAETTATIGTDWFIDEAFLVPTSDGASSVQDLWQQFMYDRTAVIKRS